jgi:hypothetical protein
MPPYSTKHQPHQTAATRRRRDRRPMDQTGEKREPTPLLQPRSSGGRGEEVTTSPASKGGQEPSPLCRQRTRAGQLWSMVVSPRTDWSVYVGPRCRPIFFYVDANSHFMFGDALRRKQHYKLVLAFFEKNPRTNLKTRSSLCPLLLLNLKLHTWSSPFSARPHHGQISEE